MAVGTVKGLATTIAGAVAFGLFAAYFGMGGGGAKPAEMLPVLGSAWSSLAVTYTVDRNRGSVVEDVWFALEPTMRRQLVAICAAWLPIAYVQALLTSLVIVAARPNEWLSALLRMHVGFATGVPACLLLGAVARLVPGFSLLAGFTFLLLLLFSRALWPIVSNGHPATSTLTLMAYGLAAVAVFLLLTRSSGRSR